MNKGLRIWLWVMLLILDLLSIPALDSIDNVIILIVINAVVIFITLKLKDEKPEPKE